MRFTVQHVMSFFTAGWLIAHVQGAERFVHLPGHLRPTSYQLTAIPILEPNHRLCAHVWIDFTVMTPTDEIVLHAAELTIQRVILLPPEAVGSLNDQFESVEQMCFSPPLDSATSPETFEPIVSMNVDPKTELLSFRLSEQLEKGLTYRMGLWYTGQVNDNQAKGFFRIPYKRTEADCCQRWIGATQLEAVHARKVFPCMDEPSFKATVSINIGHSPALKSISNMPLRSSQPMKLVEGWVWDTYETSPPMPTYLVAFVLTELGHVESSYRSINGRNVTLRFWAQDHLLDQLGMAAEFVPKIMTELETYLDTPYSLPKLDMIAIPSYDARRAMENWGLVVQSQDNMLLDRNLNLTAYQRCFIALTMCHELSHQFFGNLVTSPSFDDIWLNEGMATLFENIILNKIAPELESDVIVSSFYQQAMSNDKLGGANPLDLPVQYLAAVEDKFDGFIYIKGSALFRMVKSFIGEQAFRSALQRYFTIYQYGNADSGNLWNLMNQEARRHRTISGRMNVGRIMKSWTSKTGYPLILVERTANGVHVSQTPFVSDPTFSFANHLKPENLSTIAWWFPVSMATAESPQFDADATMPVAWLSPKKPLAELAGPKSNSSWLVVNLEISAYCRVYYDEENWALISQQLLRNHTVIPAFTRAQLIDDAFTFAHLDMHSYRIPSRLIQYISESNEIDSIRTMAGVHIQRLQEKLESQNSVEEGNNELREILQEMHDGLHRGRNAIQFSGKGYGFADGHCVTGDKDCVDDAPNLFQTWIDGASSQSRSALDDVDAVWCTSIRQGGPSVWDMAWKAALTSEAAKRKKILQAMTCTTDPVHMNQLLNRVFHPIINQKPDETRHILLKLAANSVAPSKTLKFIVKNFGFLRKHFGLSTDMEGLLHAFANSHSVEELDKVKSVLKRLSNLSHLVGFGLHELETSGFIV